MPDYLIKPASTSSGAANGCFLMLGVSTPATSPVLAENTDYEAYELSAPLSFRTELAAPTAIGLADVTGTEGTGPFTADLTGAFTGTALSYSASQPWASIVGTDLVIEDGARADTLAVTATNTSGSATITINVNIATVAASVPGAFSNTDWSLVDNQSGGDLRITIANLPADGGASLTGLEYRLDGGVWNVLTGTPAPGDFNISGLTDDVAVSVDLRAVNNVGAGSASDIKTATPTNGVAASAPDAFAATEWYLSNSGSGASANILVASLPADNGSPLTELSYRIDGGVWTNLGGVTPGNYTIGGLTEGATYIVELRSVNAIGSAPASDTKSVTISVAAATLSDPTFDEATDAFGFTASEAGTVHVVTHLTSETFGNTDAAEIIAGSSGRILEKFTIDLPVLGQQSFSLQYGLTTGDDNDTRAFSYVLDTPSGVSNVVSQNFTVNPYREYLVSPSAGTVLNNPEAIDTAPQANNLIFLSLIPDNVSRQVVLAWGNNTSRVGLWSSGEFLCDFEGAQNGGEHGDNTQSAGFYTGGVRTNLLVSTQESGGNIVTAAYAKLGNSAWTQVFNDTISGNTAISLNGPVALLADASGNRAYNAGLARIAMWTGLALPVDVSQPAVQDRFVSANGMLVNDGYARLDFGPPKIDFSGPPSIWGDGEHLGTLGTFLATGDFTGV